jgi:hypothetical protein
MGSSPINEDSPHYEYEVFSQDAKLLEEAQLFLNICNSVFITFRWQEFSSSKETLSCFSRKFPRFILLPQKLRQ